MSPTVATELALDLIADERRRQRMVEGWTPEHDDEHKDGSLALAAACYALAGTVESRGKDGGIGVMYGSVLLRLWPRSWDWKWWKPKDRRRDLVRAGALIVAELERLDREEASHG